jgi:MoxR-like ATPase
MTPSEHIEHALFEVRRVVVGQERMLERVMACILSRGHALIEGVPGIGKTLTVKTLADVLGGSFARIQFTPDLIPADIVGTRIYRASSETFDIETGPVLANFVLADEINRAPAKVQSALLEVMGEHQVTIGDTTFPTPEPFLVLATQNPIESEGVYRLPEAQRDRFLMRIPVDYPSDVEERAIVARMHVKSPTPAKLFDPEDVIALQEQADAVFVDEKVTDYAVRLVLATRNPAEHGVDDLDGLLAYGASPRASIGLVRAARAMALMRGRSYAIPQDVYDIAYDVLNHRLVLSYDALADGVTVDHVLVRILSTVWAPRITSIDRGEVDHGGAVHQPDSARSERAPVADSASQTKPATDPSPLDDTLPLDRIEEMPEPAGAGDTAKSDPPQSGTTDDGRDDPKPDEVSA